MAKHTITETDTEYPIQPQHINTNKHFWDGFGNFETENTARMIVILCQLRKSWAPFTQQDVDKNFSSAPGASFNLAGLLDNRLISRASDGKYYLTHEFICSCYRSSPAL